MKTRKYFQTQAQASSYLKSRGFHPVDLCAQAYGWVNFVRELAASIRKDDNGYFAHVVRF